MSDLNANMRKQVNHTITYLQLSTDDLDLIISNTPTSETRNELTEANIHVLLALTKLKDLVK